MRPYPLLPILMTGLLFLNACKKDKQEVDQPKIFTASGNIQNTLDQFRAELGTLNTLPGAESGRREISWESIPDTLLDRKLPPQFFNQTAADANPSFKKGLVYSPDGDFRVSRTGFAGVDPQAAGEFSAFSGTATFANVGANEWPVGFQRAGTTESAAVKGFGIIVSDVDVANSVKIELFSGTQSLGVVGVPAHEAGTNFSFAGIIFKTTVITSVKISHQGVLNSGEKDISQGGANDLVVMDDFIYGEPVRN